MASALAFRRRQPDFLFGIHLCDPHRIVLPAAESARGSRLPPRDADSHTAALWA